MTLFEILQEYRADQYLSYGDGGSDREIQPAIFWLVEMNMRHDPRLNQEAWLSSDTGIIFQPYDRIIFEPTCSRKENANFVMNMDLRNIEYAGGLL